MNDIIPEDRPFDLEFILENCRQDYENSIFHGLFCPALSSHTLLQTRLPPLFRNR